MNKFLRCLELLATGLSILIYSGTPLDTFLTDGFTVKDTDRLIFRVFYSLTYIASIVLILPQLKKAIKLLSQDKFIFILVAVSTISLIWSVDPDATVRRAMGLAGTTLFGVYLATRYTLKQQLKLCAVMFGISALLCFALAIALPHYGIDHKIVGGAWRGIYINKNTLGKRFVLSAAIFLFLALNTQKKIWISWLGCVISIFLILFSTSKTSLLNIGLIAVVSWFLVWILRWKLRSKVVFLTGGASLALLFAGWLSSSLDSILSFLGRDATLTGRTDLWPWVVTMIQEKPWLGYGYGAFWLDSNSESATLIKAVKWNAPNAHNGLLDVWLAIGLLGVVLFLVGFSINYLRGIYLMFQQRSPNGYWLLIYLTFIFLSNLTETTLLEQNSLEWVLYVAAVLSSWSLKEDIPSNPKIITSELETSTV
jgi:exopolysaccharide production protein ExoQ